MTSAAETKSEPVKTGADRLLDLVKGSREISMAEAAKQLGVPVATVEAWSDFLEEDGLISVKYKFTTPYLAPPEAPKIKTKGKPLRLISEEFGEGLGGVELVELKSSIESLSDLLTTAHEQKAAGEFGLLRQTSAELLPKLKFVHDKLSSRGDVPPQKKVALNESLRGLDNALQMAADYVAKGKFDQASVHYSNLYAQAQVLVVEVNKLFEQIVTLQTLQETKDYKDLLAKVYELMAEGKIEEAKQLYEKLKFAHENLAKEFVEKRRQMEEDLVKLNKDLAKRVDQLNIQKLKKLTSRITVLLAAGNKILEKGEFDKAEAYYLAIKKDYGSLPHGFAGEKKELQQAILNFYSSLSMHRENALRKRFDDAVKQIEYMLKDVQELIREDRIESAIRLYKQIKLLFTKLPKGFLKEKESLQEKVIPVYTTITAIYTQEAIRTLKARTAELMSLLNTMKAYTEKGELKAAEQTYERIKELYEEMPKGFLHEETALQNQIVKAYENYLKRAKQSEIGSFDSTIASVSKLLEQGEKQLKKNNYDAANYTYLQIMRIYNTLPHGFVAQKTEVRERVLRLYKALLSAEDQTVAWQRPVLQVQQKQGQEPAARAAPAMPLSTLGSSDVGVSSVSSDANGAVGQILKLITDFHTAASQANFQFMEQVLPKLDALSDRVPNLAKTNPRILSKIADLKEELELYTKASSLQTLFETGQIKQLKAALDFIRQKKEALRQRCPEDKTLFDYASSQYHIYLSKLMTHASSSATALPMVLPMAASSAQRQSQVNELDEVQRKIEELKNLTKATVRLPQ